MNRDQLTLDSTLAEYAQAIPDCLPVLESLRLDYCCGGHRPLAEAARARGLDPAVVRATLLSAAPRADADPVERDWSGASLPELVAHVTAFHHHYLRGALDRLVPLADKVARVHGDEHPELVALDRELHEFATIMRAHLDQEEQVDFPAMAALAEGGRVAMSPLALAALETDHQEAGAMLARMRGLAADYQPPAGACRSWQGLLHGLAEMETDTHRHIHKENNLLIPKVRALAAAG